MLGRIGRDEGRETTPGREKYFAHSASRAQRAIDESPFLQRLKLVILRGPATRFPCGMMRENTSSMEDAHLSKSAKRRADAVVLLR